MQLTKIEVACPLVPLYFAFDSTALVPDGAEVGRPRRRLSQVARGQGGACSKGYADARGDQGVQRRTVAPPRRERARRRWRGTGSPCDVAVRGEGATDPVLTGTTEHDYAYNRRVELKSK